jgi:hypothetical protein
VLGVQNGKNFQYLRGRITGINHTDEAKSKDVINLTSLLNQRFDARVYDPCYIDLEDQANATATTFAEKYRWPNMVISQPRRESSFWHFANDFNPIKILSTAFIPSQLQPLYPPGILCGLFFPERELADERAASIILMQPLITTSLKQVEESHRSEATIKKRVEVHRYFMENGLWTGELEDRIGVEKDGTVRIANWEAMQFSVTANDLGQEWDMYFSEKVTNWDHLLRSLWI